MPVERRCSRRRTAGRARSGGRRGPSRPCSPPAVTMPPMSRNGRSTQGAVAHDPDAADLFDDEQRSRVVRSPGDVDRRAEAVDDRLEGERRRLADRARAAAGRARRCSPPTRTASVRGRPTGRRRSRRSGWPMAGPAPRSPTRAIATAPAIRVPSRHAGDVVVDAWRRRLAGMLARGCGTVVGPVGCYPPHRGGMRSMDAWELDDLEAAREATGRPYHEFLSVPDLSGGLYVLEAGATDPQSPHTEDELYVVMSGQGPGHGRRRGAGRPCRHGGLRRRRRDPPVPRHRGAPRAPRRLRAGRGLARLARQRRVPSHGPARRGRQLERQLRPAPDLVVAEEDEHVVAGGKERGQPVGPAADLVGRVVVPAQPQVQERRRPAQGRRLGLVRIVRRAQRGPRGRQGRDRLVRLPGGIPQLDGQWQVARPRRQEGRQLARRRGGACRGPGRARSRAAPRRRGTARSATAGRARATPPNAPHEPPRWALTLNRNVGGVASSQAATFAADGCW